MSLEALSKGHPTLDLADDPTAVGLGPRTSRALKAICDVLNKGLDLSSQGRPREGGWEEASLQTRWPELLWNVMPKDIC